MVFLRTISHLYSKAKWDPESIYIVYLFMTPTVGCEVVFDLLLGPDVVWGEVLLGHVGVDVSATLFDETVDEAPRLPPLSGSLDPYRGLVRLKSYNI